MWHIHPTEKWIDDVVAFMNEHQLKPEDSKFMIAFFSSMDNRFVKYFKQNKNSISSFSGMNFHIFTPIIYENNVIPDEQWRYMRSEFASMGLPISSDPTFVFFKLDKRDYDRYEPSFFAGFRCRSFNDFPNKLKYAIDICISISDVYILQSKLSEIFLSENIIPYDKVDHLFKQTITNKLPKSTIFVSHSNSDKPFARRLIDSLAADKTLTFWIDEREIVAGDDIQVSVTRSLRASDYLLILISEYSARSSWVNFEIAQFMSITDNMNIIPILLSKGHSFPGPVDNLVRRLKYIDFSDETKWYENLDTLRQAFAKKKPK